MLDGNFRCQGRNPHRDSPPGPRPGRRAAIAEYLNPVAEIERPMFACADRAEIVRAGQSSIFRYCTKPERSATWSYSRIAA